ncbi:PREDICTED: uncharacterized protein LOC109584762 [Amphimedon queenslandica]|nr:PREDICTED: uncharacterized protein LOC109584762 [Amphimedon queenslandica]|eukprot:XP_019856163.1 PREDICTED: uncharacterized protein LOC109584762 [Amphimedon queenslandica]
MTTQVANNDQNDVYFRFGGATLASMLHNRYKEIRSCSAVKRELISVEITILQAINNKDKSAIPAYLQYRDKGFMYFPDITFIPFIRAVDECAKQVVNEKGLKDHGDELIKVTHSIVKLATHLKSQLVDGLRSKMALDTDIEKQATDNVYDEMLRKLTNTRIQEFMSSFKQKMAFNSGHASTAGLNLRDQLLSQHVQVQSRVQLD